MVGVWLDWLSLEEKKRKKKGSDSNGNGVAEIGLLEVNGAGNVQVQIKDPLTGALVVNLPYPKF